MRSMTVSGTSAIPSSARTQTVVTIASVRVNPVTYRL